MGRRGKVGDVKQDFFKRVGEVEKGGNREEQRKEEMGRRNGPLKFPKVIQEGSKGAFEREKKTKLTDFHKLSGSLQGPPGRAA